jgi:DNA-binding IclR family transcriptional regulator
MKNESDYYIESIKRAIQILNSFTLEEKELGVTELSHRLKLHKSTIHRILVTLASEGIMVKNPDNQKYSLGMSLFRWGSIVQQQMEFRKYALPIMENLAKKTKECIYLNVILGRRRISVERVESSHEVRRIIRLGESLPLYTGGSGKVILANLPDEEIKKFLKEEQLIPYTKNTITDPEKLLENLKGIREKGYAIAVGERVMGATTIGAPIFDYANKVVASLTISGPTERFTEKKIPLFISLVKEAAEKISVSLGYQPKD